MMIHVDYAVSEDCINSDSCGMICVKCGCCSRNSNYRDMMRRRIKYYKRMLQEEYSFSYWDENKEQRAFQERNVKANILYFKRKIRICKKILRAKE